MIKLVLGGFLGIIGGVLLTTVLIRPMMQQRMDILAEKSRPNMSDFKNDRLEAMKTAKDDKAILERLIKSGDDELLIIDPAKSKSKHPELTKFAQDSAYSAAYNRELGRVLMEQFGYAPSHGTGKHCDSVGC